MQFTRELQRLLTGIIGLFLLLVLAAAYWSITGPDTILARQDNPRLFEAQADIVRGDLVDRNGTVLVTSVQADTGRVSREFRYPAMNSITGYYSLRYGVGGAEALYNRLLRGDDLPRDLTTYFNQDVLHQPVRGSDVQLTLDLPIQQVTVDALTGYTGAAVVLDVPTGEVLALASLPTFDPNTLDVTWEQLITAPEEPFFNRVLQGKYQPGGILQTPLMTVALLTDVPVDVPVEGASQGVEVDGVPLSCARQPPADRLALSEAYAFGCPAPFVTLYEAADRAQVQEVFGLFLPGESAALTALLPTTPTLSPNLTADLTPEVFPLATLDIVPAGTPDPGIATPPGIPEITLENALGQGDLTLSPLDVAMMTAAIVNEGNAPQPVLLHATRTPDQTTWKPVSEVYPSIPVTTAEISRRLQEMMRTATISGSATRAARSGMTIGGHAVVAYSGDSTYVWFTGFVITGARQGVVVALVLETDADGPVITTQEASAIGGQILEAAFNRSVVPLPATP